MSERNEISIHEVRIYQALRDAKGWLTNAGIGVLIDDVRPRTIRAHTARLVLLGIIDQAEVFPAHRYRFSEKAGKRNKAYLQRLEAAAEVFKTTNDSKR